MPDVKKWYESESRVADVVAAGLVAMGSVCISYGAVLGKVWLVLLGNAFLFLGMRLAIDTARVH